MDRGKALARVRAARVGRIATVMPDGRPHVVPFVFALVENEDTVVAYWAVDQKPKRSVRLQRLRNLDENAAAEFVVDGYDEDWNRLWWVRCSGAGRVVGAGDERAAALASLGKKYPVYRASRPTGPVVAIDVDRVIGWEADAGSP